MKIDYRHYKAIKLLVIGLKVRSNGIHGFLFQFKNIILLIKICQIQA